MKSLTLDELYDLEIKWRYNYDDEISVVAFNKADADYKYKKEINISGDFKKNNM